MCTIILNICNVDERVIIKAKQIDTLQRIQWWNWDDDRLQEVERMFEDIDGFIKKYDL